MPIRANPTILHWPEHRRHLAVLILSERDRIEADMSMQLNGPHGPKSDDLKNWVSSARKIVVFDLEWTSWPGFWESNWAMPGKHREVIQIGAVVLDRDRGFGETGAFDLIVKPRINPQLSPYIQALTGLTQEKIEDEGSEFPDAITKFTTFCEEADVLFVNGEDGIVIAENCQLHEMTCPATFQKTRNVRPSLKAALPAEKAEFTSSELASHFGLAPVGEAHDALADARGIAATIKYLLDGSD